jgi:hypothetical protein
LSSDTRVEERINLLDPLLFAKIPSQSNTADKVVWLALQRAIRNEKAAYSYLEIGSHLGGSLQPHLLDPKCCKIFSIDKRPVEQPDERGVTLLYEGNSTERMLHNLRSISLEQTAKVTCFESDAKEVDRTLIEPAPDICFIDGEHTDAAVLSDFEFCVAVCAPNALLVFHDAQINYGALGEIHRRLGKRKIPFVSLKAQGCSTHIIALRNCPVQDDATVEHLTMNGKYWLRMEPFTALAKRYVPKALLPRVRSMVRRLLGFHRRSR